MMGSEQEELVAMRIENLVEELTRCKSRADILLVEFRKTMSDRKVLALKLEAANEEIARLKLFIPPETK